MIVSKVRTKSYSQTRELSMTEETIVTKADALDAKSETYTQIRTNIPVFLNTDISHLQGIYFSLKLSLYALNAVFCDVFVMKNGKVKQLTIYLVELK